MQWLLIISTFFVFGSTFGQQLDAKISKTSAKIGEPLTLRYTLKTGSKDTIVFYEKYGEIPMRAYGGGQLSNNGFAAEILTNFSDSSYKIRGGKEWLGEYEVMIWDSGTFIIPGPKIVINDSTFFFDDIRVYVDFSAKKSGVDLYDIRENYAKLPEEESAFIGWVKRNWWIVAIVIAAAIGLLWFINKRKPKEPIRITKAMSLKERTLAAIDALENERLWEQDKLKEHFIELSYIMRSYLTARYDIALLEKTTFQTKQLLLQKGLNDDTVDTIVRILSHSDMVKFARSMPDEIAILKISTLARQIVAETSPLEFDNYE
ncbi:MAG: hypothetical protein NXI10_04425 [bacterium]|nr:hypothetical protein [bacterium]